MARFSADKTTMVLIDGPKISEITLTPRPAVGDTVRFQVTETTFDGAYGYSGTGVENVVTVGLNPVLAIERSYCQMLCLKKVVQATISVGIVVVCEGLWSSSLS